jgi:Class III cytochrome C family
MRKRNSILVLSVACGLVFLAIETLQAQSNITPPKDVKIYSDAFKKHLKGPVLFNHEEHTVKNKIACTECHHLYKDGKNVWKEGDPVQKCDACHIPHEKKGNAERLQLAFHGNCQGCHKELKDKKAPYRVCNDCHQKKE